MKREGLLVLGMHRGGTSAVAGLLVRLGAQGPKTLMPANADNPAGYWESAVFHELHEKLLRTAGSRWDAFTRLEPERLRSATPAALSDECRSTLDAEFGPAPRFVLKDPRMCRFVPFWLEILQEECVSSRAILVLRSPGQVARSLAARNGFEPDLSLLIWLRHMLDAERDTRAVQRTFVRYSDLLDSWVPVAQRISQDLQLAWPSRSTFEDGEISRFVSPRLCHHNGDPYVTGVTPVLTDWTQTVWAALGSLHDRDTSRTGQASTALDTIRAELDRHTSVLGEVRDQIYETLLGQIDNLEREQRALRKHAAELEQHAAELQALHDAVRHRIEVLEREAGVLKHELSAAQANVEALRKSASWRVTAPLRAMYRMLR